MTFQYLSRSLLRSFSQIMLQENKLTGFLFCLGLGISSPIMLFGAVIAVLSSLVIAELFLYSENNVQKGLYGYNAALVGIAVFFFLPANTLSLALVIFGGGLSTAIMHLLTQVGPTKKISFPVFTAPFVITTWLLIMLIEFINFPSSFVNGLEITNLNINSLYISDAANNTGVIYALLRGIAQIMLQDNWLSGALFVFALLLHSYKVASWAVIGSASGLLFAGMFNFNEEWLLMGNYGFNGSLLAIALHANFEKNQRSIFNTRALNTILFIGMMCFGLILTVLLTSAFEQARLPALTAPFILSTWFILALHQSLNRAYQNKQQKVKLSRCN